MSLSLNRIGAVKARREAVGKCLRRFLAVEVGLDHHELVAAEPRHHVARPRRRAQALGDGLEHEIAAIVTEAVVDLLEAVDVDEMHRERAAARRQGVERLVQLLDQARTVGETRQRIMMRQEADAPVAMLLLLGAAVETDGRNPEREPRQQAKRHRREQESAVHPVTLLGLIHIGRDDRDRELIDQHGHVGARVERGQVRRAAFLGLDHGQPGHAGAGGSGAVFRQGEQRDLAVIRGRAANNLRG